MFAVSKQKLISCSDGRTVLHNSNSENMGLGQFSRKN